MSHYNTVRLSVSLRKTNLISRRVLLISKWKDLGVTWKLSELSKLQILDSVYYSEMHIRNREKEISLSIYSIR